eukprot:TRINITY_DN41080_c0_g1_i1.p1 TRINITY_DN41080_c0_g1~~TRINITY_DN41080_c0_g1_i1.p1  ORF type:complete len:538 (-),score=139.82 TRINITY_DN41080_c0_g1_i1:56-1669(-)
MAPAAMLAAALLSCQLQQTFSAADRPWRPPGKRQRRMWIDALGRHIDAPLHAVGCYGGDGQREALCCGVSAPASCLLEERSKAACCPPAEDASRWRTCVARGFEIPDFGRVSAWALRVAAAGDDAGSQWIQLLVLRPILVGWRQGYKGRTFGVVGASGPILIDTGTTEHMIVEQPANGGRLQVRPGDLLGWRSAQQMQPSGGPAEQAVELPPADADVWCMGPKPCDDVGLCQFKLPLLGGLKLEVSVEVWPERLPNSRAQRPILEGLDLSGQVTVNTSYEEFLTLRNKLEHPNLHMFEDKIRIRKETLPNLAVKPTPPILLTNSEPEKVFASIEGKTSYVVKPSHMSESQNVFVMRGGVNILQKAWGHPDPHTTAAQIQETVHSFWKTSALDWECKALVTVKPGVVVEELVLSNIDGAGLKVDEYKFYTVWGEVVFGESVPFSSGAVNWIDRWGNIMASKGTCPPYCVPQCYPRMVEIAEKVARGTKTDMLRVDILIHGNCEDLFVSELELFPASDFDPVLRAEMAARWRRGYGLAA